HPSAGTQPLGVNLCGGGGCPRSCRALARAERHIFPDDEVDSIILLEVAPWDIKAFYNETAPENQRYIVGYYHQIHDTHVEDIAATLEEAVEKFKLFVEDCQE